MADSTHYSVLGVPENATSDEIRRSYRRLVLKYHPDRSGDTSTTDVFVRITEAYRALSDQTRRADYDRTLEYRRDRATQQQARTTQQPPRQQPRAATPAEVSARLAEAVRFHQKNRFDEAETAAKKVLLMDPRRALAHSILGDIARSRQDYNEAVARYAYAVQYEPNNAVFLKKYEDLLRMTSKPTGKVGRVTLKEPDLKAAGVASVLCGMMLFYIVMSDDKPAGFFAPVSTWTLGLLLTMFVSGVAAGLSLAISRVIDGWQGNLRPWFAALGIVSFWLAAAVYVGLGLWKQSFSFTMSRSVTAVAALTAAFALSATASFEISPLQTLLWGGNIIFIGYIAGWTISDAFK